MPTKLEFTVDRQSFARAKEEIRAMRQRAGNLIPAWNVFLNWFADGNRQQFGSQGKRWGTPWRELKPQSVAAKRRDGWMGDILVRESILLRSVADRPLQLERLGPHDMSAGTAVRHAAAHHFGSPRAGIPRRPLWSIKRIQDEGAATSVIKTWIVSGRPTVRARTQR